MSRKFLRPFCLLALVAALLFAGVPAAVPADASSGPGDSGEEAYVTDEVNVKLLRASDLQAVSDQYHVKLIEQFGARPIYRMRVTDGTDSKVKAAALAADAARVQYAEANWTAGSPEGSGVIWSVGDGWDAGVIWSVGGQGQYQAQWAQDKLKLKEAHRATKGAGTIVAVLDTGVDRRHPALAGRLLRGRDFVDDDDDPSEVLPQPCAASADPAKCGPYGHGTHVAGLVALAAPEARIMPLRVLDAQGVGNMWVIAEAVRYALDPDGDPTSDDGADVINLSLATVHHSNLLREVIGDASDTAVPSPYAKVVVVAASGNRGTTELMYPAAENFDGELSVAASKSDDTLWEKSERDDNVRNDVMAPGVGITSSVPGGGTGVWAGTSMASPLVAGLAALVRAAAPAMSADLVKDRIRDTSDRPQPEQFVKRRVNAASAVTPLVNFNVNPIDDTRAFVRQQYLDFFNRAPDKPGDDFWSNEVAQCGGVKACVDFQRVNTSGAFFVSIEFRDTGYFVYRLHKAAFGDLSGKPVPVRYEDFMPDTQRIGEGVVVNSQGWQGRLAANREAFLRDFVTSTRFAQAYPASLTPAQFVGALYTNAGVTPSAAERRAAEAEFNGAADTADAAARARALLRVAEHAALVAKEFNRAFVLMQYFGYLRRNPDDVGFDGKADPAFSGFNFWLKKLDDEGGDFHKAELVRAFIESIEFRQRFRG
jgi:thermitase